MNEHIIPIPWDVERILDTISRHGHACYIVGGCVRDFYLGRKPKDWDITTSMRPDDVISLFRSIPGAKIIPTGLKHGTVTIIPPYSTESYEITTFRTDGTYSDGRHPDQVQFSDTIEQDLSRRDLTINAMAWSPIHGLIDPYHGLSDLEHKIVRTVGCPDHRFQEDALRMMRAVRFCAQLTFTLETKTLLAISRNASLITKVSPERRMDEIAKILMSSHPEMLEELETTGLMQYVLPEIHRLFETPQNHPWHIYKDVGHHTMESLCYIPANLELRLAMLFHDVGKPDSHTVGEDGYDHFHGHPAQSAILTEQILRRNHVPNQNIENVCKLIAIHDLAPEPNERAVRRFAAKYSLDKETFARYHAVVEADALAQNPEFAAEKCNNNDHIYHIFLKMQNPPMKVTDLAVNGHHMTALGLKGPAIGAMLKELLEIVLDDPSKNTMEQLLQITEARIQPV